MTAARLGILSDSQEEMPCPPRLIFPPLPTAPRVYGR
jgi:hypothetical protein